MQDDMVSLRKVGKTEEQIYSDFYNSSKTFNQTPIDQAVRVGFALRQVDFFKEWDVVSTIINEEGFTALLKLQNEKYFPIIVKLFYKDSSELPYLVEQIV